MKQLGLAFLGLSLWMGAHADEALQAAVQSPTRTPAYVARDVWRHPEATLTFFGVRADSTVVELSPGPGWYT
jgi:predicted methyltransferase